MGGYPHGEIAAEVVLRSMGLAFRREARSELDDPIRFLRNGVLDAHHAIAIEAKQRGLDTVPRTTCVACVIQRGVAYWAHAGDSRLYLLRQGRVALQTRDHSQVQRLIDTGQIREEVASSHPGRNRIYSCLGGNELPMLSLSQGARLNEGDIVLL